MKRLLLSLSMMALVSASASLASAQDGSAFEKEYKAFKQKLVTPKEPDPVPEPAPMISNPMTSNAQKQTGSPVPPSLTLGPAGNLPVSGQPPATSYAIGVQSPEEMQARMDADMETQRKKNEEADFNDALKALLPLSPPQIRKMLESFKDSREAAETPVALPTPVIQVETISLDPSQTPPVIKTATGRVTTLTVLDSTGSPWPIQDVSWAGKFEVTPPEEGGHVVRITPQTTHGVGNLSMRLVDLITPITFTVEVGLDEVYYRFDARIPKQGPLAKTPLIAYGGLKAVAGADDNLVQILDGTPPVSSEKLKVDGADGRTNVWRVSGKIYLRTPLTLLSPSWDSSVTSADGMNVYTLNDTPVILLSDEGRMVRVHIASDGATP